MRQPDLFGEPAIEVQIKPGVVHRSWIVRMPDGRIIGSSPEQPGTEEYEKDAAALRFLQVAMDEIMANRPQKPARRKGRLNG